MTQASRTYFFAILTGCTVASVAFALAQSPQKPTKAEILRGPANSKPLAAAKTSGLLEVTIESSSGPVRAVGDAIELTATVTAKTDLDNLQFAWNLPEGISALSAIEGGIGHLDKDAKTTVTFKGLSQTAENRQIHLHVFHRNNGEAMGQMTQYNTVDQPQIAKDLKSKAEILQNAAQDKGTRFKVMQ